MMATTRETLIWESYDGRKTLVKDLEVRHLVNILNHIKESNDEAELANMVVYPPNVCQVLEAEGELRVMAGWAANIGIPRHNADGTWTLINQTANERAFEDAKSALHRAEMDKPRNKRLRPHELMTELEKIQQAN